MAGTAAPNKRRFQEVAASFPTNFAAILRDCPPPLVRGNGEEEDNDDGNSSRDKQQNRLKVFLKICPTTTSSSSSSSAADPTTTTTTAATSNGVLECHGNSVHLNEPTQFSATKATPKKSTTTNRSFSFNAIFNQEATMMEICSRTLEGVLNSVVRGIDACLFSYGHARLGKTYTMLGVDDRADLLGIIPCSIAWLFHMLDDLKKSSGMKFSVRVSALEVTGKQEGVKDLLSESFSSEVKHSTSGSTTDGDVMEMMREYRAPTPEHAALFLDAAVAARTIPNDNDRRNSHFLYTLHVQQHRLEENQDGIHGLISYNSRLHLLDLGSCSKHRDSGSTLSLSELGNIILSLLNGKKFLPHCDSKVTRLLKTVFLSSPNISTCMLAHVSPLLKSYHHTLQVLHFSSQIQRTSGKRKPKIPATDDSTNSGSTKGSDVDYSSSSEQSVDTVIFVAKKNSDPNGSDPATVHPPSANNPISVNNAPADKVTPPRAKIYSKLASNAKKSGDSFNGIVGAHTKITTRTNSLDEARSSPIDERGQPQGREGCHSYHECCKVTPDGDGLVIGNETEHELGGERKVNLPESSSNCELWIDGPTRGAMLCEHWVDGPQEFWTTPCPGIHGLKSPKIKKLYSALKQKHQQELNSESPQKLNWEGELRSGEDKVQQQQQQSQSLQTLSDEKCFVTASPEITAFHNFFAKHKQDLLHNKFSFPNDSKFPHDLEDFLPENCCCKCHLMKNECKLNSPKSPKHVVPSKENRHPRAPKTDRVKGEHGGKEVQEDRIADWVSSVQDSGFSKFSQLLQSRKELIKSFQSPKNRHNLKPVLMEYFQNASPLATFDEPVSRGESNSPPPDYNSCVGNSRLDINENQMTSQNNRSSLQSDNSVDCPKANNCKEDAYVRKTSAVHRHRPPVKVCNGTVTTGTFPGSIARKLGPDGASCHSLHEEPTCADERSIHDSLKRDRSKKNHGGNLKNSRNYSSSETIFTPSLQNSKESDKSNAVRENSLSRLPSQMLPHSASPSRTITSPKKERCSLAMALLSCAARYRRKAEGAQSRNKPHAASSAFCLGQPSSEGSDAEVQEQRMNSTKRDLLVIHAIDNSGTNSYRSTTQTLPSVKTNTPIRPSR